MKKRLSLLLAAGMAVTTPGGLFERSGSTAGNPGPCPDGRGNDGGRRGQIRGGVRSRGGSGGTEGVWL